MIGINKCLNPGQQIVAQDFLSGVFIFMLFFSFYISLFIVYSNVNYVLLFTLHKSDVLL